MYDGLTQESGRDGVQKQASASFSTWLPIGQSQSSHRMLYNVHGIGRRCLWPQLFILHSPPPSCLPPPLISSVEGIRNLPFASAVFAYRMVSPMSRDLAKHKHLFTKGMLQANPLCYYTEIGFGDDNAAVTSMKGTGVYHPVNAPYDFAFQDVSAAGTTTSPFPNMKSPPTAATSFQAWPRAMDSPAA